MKTYWYDVCCDDSLQLRDTKPDLREYIDFPMDYPRNAVAWVTRRYDELHYLSSNNKHLTGVRVIWT